MTAILDFSASLEMTSAVRARMTRRAHGVRVRRCVEGAAISLDDALRFLGFARNDKLLFGLAGLGARIVSGCGDVSRGQRFRKPLL